MIDLGAVKYILIVLIDALAAVAWMLVLSRIDPNAARKRHQAMVPVFFLGGLASAPLCHVFYWLNDLGFLYHEGNASVVLFYMIVVGLCEEGAKLVAFLVISTSMKSIKEPLDPIIQGASVGLAFGIVENFSYAVAYDIKLLLLRSFVTIVAHMSYTALAAFIFGASRYWSVDAALKRWLPFTGLAVAIIPHGIYNSMLTLNDHAGIAFTFNLVMLGLLAALVWRTSLISPYRSFSPDCWKEAVAAISAALEFDPKNPWFAARRGWYQVCARQYVDAIVDFDRAGLMGPRSAYVTVWRTVAELLAEPGATDAGVSDAGVSSNGAMESALAPLSAPQRLRFRNEVKQVLHGADRERILAEIDCSAAG